MSAGPKFDGNSRLSENYFFSTDNLYKFLFFIEKLNALERLSN